MLKQPHTDCLDPLTSNVIHVEEKQEKSKNSNTLNFLSIYQVELCR
jgi:hypothetical protein